MLLSVNNAAVHFLANVAQVFLETIGLGSGALSMPSSTSPSVRSGPRNQLIALPKPKRPD
ncbi:hypothetical protein [uncultured Lamprocystis sp.]|jgi:hypothetical protein|uniref:hypothetical protein n=1 Tax=uncultured Lamprocystis sp. TaxID=543132 RepID=UPI0025EFE0C4|nr:hypothetical protein [uncultured Lamprocystis sp.]